MSFIRVDNNLFSSEKGLSAIMAKEEKTPDAASDSSVKPSTWVESVSKMMAEVVEKDAGAVRTPCDLLEMVGDFRKRYLGTPAVRASSWRRSPTADPCGRFAPWTVARKSPPSTELT